MRTERWNRMMWTVLGAIVLVSGCGPGQVRAPNPTRALEERRAIEIIRRAMNTGGIKPAPGRDIQLVTGKTIHIDVSVEGHDYGIAYITSDDAQDLGSAIPTRNQKDERLRLVRGGPDGEVRLVLLYQENYLYDDLVGEQHEQTAITSERLLSRDVQDFVQHAQTQKFK